MTTATNARKHETTHRSSSCLRVFVAVAAMALTVNLRAETGYDLWLRYTPLADDAQRAAYRRSATAIVVESRSPTGATIAVGTAARTAGTAGRASRPRGSPVNRRRGDRRHAVVVAARRRARMDGRARARRATRATSFARRRVGGRAVDRHRLGGRDRRALRRVPFPAAASRPGSRSRALDIAERPRLERRLLNHWDNLDGTIERGYAGRSLWDWHELPDRSIRASSTTRAPTPRSASTAPSSTTSTRTRSR